MGKFMYDVVLAMAIVAASAMVACLAVFSAMGIFPWHMLLGATVPYVVMLGLVIFDL
jgi:hypothetical protein